MEDEKKKKQAKTCLKVLTWDVKIKGERSVPRVRKDGKKLFQQKLCCKIESYWPTCSIWEGVKKVYSMSGRVTLPLFHPFKLIFISLGAFNLSLLSCLPLFKGFWNYNRIFRVYLRKPCQLFGFWKMKVNVVEIALKRNKLFFPPFKPLKGGKGVRI